VGCGARCIGRDSAVTCVGAMAEGLSVGLLLIHKLVGSGAADLAKDSVKERGKAPGGLLGLEAAKVGAGGSAGMGGCSDKRIFTWLRGAVGRTSSRARGSRSLRAQLRPWRGLVGWCWESLEAVERGRGAMSAEGGMSGAVAGSKSAEVAGLNREPERALACGTAGAKRLEVRSVHDGGNEGVGLREGSRMLCIDLDG
jgi:hypothetical protein